MDFHQNLTIFILFIYWAGVIGATATGDHTGIKEPYLDTEVSGFFRHIQDDCPDIIIQGDIAVGQTLLQWQLIHSHVFQFSY